MPTNYIEAECKSALHELKRKIPYGWDLNIYRGCQHACQYCYAMYSHQYTGTEDFFNDIHVKTNIHEILEKELAASSWKREIVNIGGVTDAYQQAEATYQLMPDILKLMIKYKTPIIISSKSDLILRDFDLIASLSRVACVNIAQTITCMQEETRQLIEPGSSPSEQRFAVLKEFKKTNACTGLHFMPIIPTITDSEDNIEELFASAEAAGVDYALPGTLYLRGTTRKHFLEFIRTDFPDHYEQMLSIYQKGGADKTYKDTLYERVNRLRAKYNLSSSYMQPLRKKIKELAGQ